MTGGSPQSDRVEDRGEETATSHEGVFGFADRSSGETMRGAVPGALCQQAEPLTLRYGRELFQHLRGFRLPWRERIRGMLQRRILATFMGDERLRFALLRFVDVFPTLTGNAEIAAHLREYLRDAVGSGDRRRLKMARFLLHFASSRFVPDRVTAELSRRAITMMGSQFIAGRDPESVTPRLIDLERCGCRFTLDLLGEQVASDHQADAFARRYRAMIEELPRRLQSERADRSEAGEPRVNVSIKLSSLTHKFDPVDLEGTTQRVLARLRPLFEAAMRHGVFLNIDVEQYSHRDLTLHILARLLEEEPFRGFPHVGIVMQAYIPVGDLIPGMAYLVRRILENTSNDSFIRRFFYQSASVESLLKDPKERGERC